MDLREKRHRKYKEQMRSVQSSREYSAALERDRRRREVDPRAAEDRFLGLEEELETARAELSEREKRLPTETEQHEERMKDWRTAQKVDQRGAGAAEIEIARLENEIPPRDRAEFRA